MQTRQASQAIADLAKLDRIADELLLQGCCTKPPVHENLIAMFSPGECIILSTKPLGAIRGILTPTPTGWTIMLNSKLPRCARRFSLFHEGFHLLQRVGRIEVAGNDAYQEWLADQFAARILMPRRWVLERMNKAASLEHLAAMFRVSGTAMSKRLKSLGAGRV